MLTYLARDESKGGRDACGISYGTPEFSRSILGNARRGGFDARNALAEDALKVRKIGGLRVWLGFHLSKKLLERIEQGAAR